MQKKKPIIELIRKPRFGEVKCEINREGVEISGSHRLITIAADKYQSFDIADATIQELYAPNILSYMGSIYDRTFIKVSLQVSSFLKPILLMSYLKIAA